MKLISFLLVFFKKAMFKFELEYNKQVLKSVKNFWTLPLLIDLTLRKEFYWKEYLNGKSVKDTLIEEVEKKSKRLSHRLKRRMFSPVPKEVLERYIRIQQIKENIEDIKHYFPDSEFAK